MKKLAKNCESRLLMLQLNRQKILDGSRKKHITGWWLKETRRTVQTLLKELFVFFFYFFGWKMNFLYVHLLFVVFQFHFWVLFGKRSD